MGETIAADGEELNKEEINHNLELLVEVRQAYADAGDQREDDDYFPDERCLSFLTSGWFTDGQSLAKALQAIGQYNYFEAEKVAEHTRTINRGVDDIRVAVGREGSPVLYIETDEPGDVVGVFEDYADECWEVEHDAVGNARKWSGGGGIDPHNMCKHDEPPVPVDDFAEPDPDRSVVRAWWD